MNSSKSTPVIVVLGSGRSGTSLLMQILAGLGMSVSSDMIQAKEQTPTGAYEDREIFQIQNEFVSAITPQSMPMPDNWEEDQKLPDTMARLQKIIEDRLQKAPTIWGFKDPKTAMLIPMWTKIFNRLNIVPKYILSVRAPQSVITSMKRQYGIKQNVAELFWLTRNTDAIHNTGGNCFISHYEDWFTDNAPEMANQLFRFTGLVPDLKKDIKATIAEIIRPNLNRSVYDEYEIKNRYVCSLYDSLKKCNGEIFDRNELMQIVWECRKAIFEFSGWANEAQRFLSMSSRKNIQEPAIGNKELQDELESLNVDLNKSIFEANEYLKEIKDLHDELESLRLHFSSLKHEYENEKQKKDIEEEEIRNLNSRLKNENFSLRTSTSFQVGQIFVKAIIKPGKNTILLPAYLARIILGKKFAE